MMKKQQRWIALLVVLTFAWLLQVTAMPMAAADAAERVAAAGAEQGPAFVEQEKAAAFQVRKKSIVPVLLIGAGVVVVAAVLLLVVFKTSYDIVGEWRYSWKWAGEADWSETNQSLVFSGDKKSGTLTIWGYPGTYTVDGKNVTFRFNYYENGPNDYTVNTGTFDGKDKISGTWVLIASGNTGAFEAVRGSAAAGIKPPHISSRSKAERIKKIGLKE
jgi:hypothetical protein